MSFTLKTVIVIFFSSFNFINRFAMTSLAGQEEGMKKVSCCILYSVCRILNQCRLTDDFNCVIKVIIDLSKFNISFRN